MKVRAHILAAIVLSVASAAFAQTASTAPATGPGGLAKMEALASANRASLVIVEYQLQYDKGDAPEGSGFEERCPFCGRFHGSEDLGNTIPEERPLLRGGVLVDGTHVVTDDLQLHPRFIKSIKVRSAFGDANTVDAKISGYPKDQNAVILEVAAQVPGVKPAKFEPEGAGPFTTMTFAEAEGRWSVGLVPLSQQVLFADGKALTTSGRGLVVDKDGGPVGMTTGLEIPADGGWKGSPMQWPAFSADGMKTLLTDVQSRAEHGIVPVTLNFRTPRNNNVRDRFITDEGDANVQHVLGVFVDAKRLLILSSLKPATTARLERIRVMTQPPMDAKFEASLTDFGVFVATTQTAAEGVPALSSFDIGTLRGAAIPSAEVMLHGEERTAYYQHRRIAGMNVGFRGNLYPELPTQSQNMFLFDAKGDIVALPVPIREKISTESRYSSGRSQLTSAAPLRKALADLAANSDPNNVPLTEDQENRLAWLGYELQPLNRDLARANNVSDQTQDGRMGALVTYVYPDSPAAKAGVEAGWVLLRLNMEGQPKPIDVEVENDSFSDEPFPWDRLDSAPEQVFDRIPTPWPNAENSLVRSLTDVGFGKKYTAEFFHDKKLEKKDFTIVQGPPTYVSAPKFKSDGLGITVRDLTYEVRRYMQKKEDEPGVIISKIEMGSKASKAGLKPYELITHVNDQPVKNVKEFENAVKDQTELSLSIKRMTAGRIVKVTLDKAVGTEPATKP